MTDDLYSGSIDWDRIYRTFHAPLRVARRVHEKLGKVATPVLFSGFPETASYLAELRPVTFVDVSSSITDLAEKRYVNLREVHTGDVTTLAASLPVPNVAITCRISAYWDASVYFDRLTAALRAFPRECILIDFFDRESVHPGQERIFKSGEDSGSWNFLNFEEAGENTPPFSKANMKISYSLKGLQCSYEGARSFFKKEDIVQWARSQFPDYRAAVANALVEHDPSFAITLTRTSG